MINNLLNRAVVFACDFRPRSVGGVSVIPNHGKAAGAPVWLTLGDGTTSGTFPTPLAGWGASFDGGDYVDTGVVDRYEKTDQFSLYFYGRSHPTAWNNLIDWADEGTSRGLSFRTFGGLSYYVFNGPNYNLAPSPMATVSSATLVCKGTANTEMKIYVNGVDRVLSGAGTTTSTTIKSGRAIGLGVRLIGLVSPLVGTGYAFGVFDGLLTPRDIQIIDAYVRANIR